MPSDLEDRVLQSKLRPLTKADIDCRMQLLIEEVAAQEGSQSGDRSAEESLNPRWIKPAELVRRMSRFLVYN